MHQSFLVHAGYRWAKWAVFLSVAAIVAYIWDNPPGDPNGGTWLGYTLGTIGALLILWLMWLGIKKRSYGGGSSFKGWVSAHVYLGLSLTVIATLHSGFQLGWNIHTLAYVLMMLVILSGLYGLYAYARMPAAMTEARDGRSLAEMFDGIERIDTDLARLADGQLPASLLPLIDDCIKNTKIGGSIGALLRSAYRGCPTERALRQMQVAQNDQAQDEHSDAIHAAMLLLARKGTLLQAVRQDVSLKAHMDVWLALHVPMSFALLAALSAHVFSVFYYW